MNTQRGRNGAPVGVPKGLPGTSFFQTPRPRASLTPPGRLRDPPVGTFLCSFDPKTDAKPMQKL